MKVFKNDEKGYYSWLEANPTGLVINVPTRENANNLVLHKSICNHIAKTNQPEGAFTERDFFKVCANTPKELEKWLKEDRKTFYGQLYECKHCNPSVSKIVV